MSASAGFRRAAAADKTDCSVVLDGDWAEKLDVAIDPDSKTFLEWFSQMHKEKMGRVYSLDTSKELALVRELLDSVGLEKLKQAAENMFNDPFWGKRAPCISMLSFKLSDWVHAEVGRE